MTNDPPVWFGLAGWGNCLSQTLDSALGIGTYSVGFGEGAGGKYHIGHCSCFGEEDVDDHQVVEAFERVFAVVAVRVGDESVFAVDEHGKNLLAAEIERLDLGNSLFCIHFAPVERFELRFTGGIVDRLEAGVIGRNCADIARALDIVLPAHRVDTGALPAEIAGHHGEVAQALYVVDATDVFSDDLLAKNHAIMKGVTEQVVKYSPDCVIMPVTNPLDAMAQVVYRVSGFPRERVIGMAGVLDSARMRAFISQALNVSVENTHAFVLGGHGDTMVPLPRYSTVAGIPITELLDAEQVEAIVQRTAHGGAEIVKLLGTGSAYYAPGSAVVEMVETVLKDKKKILPCSVFLKGEYGIEDLFVGVPCKLGGDGLEEIIEITLTPDEDAALKKSAEAVRELVEIINV